jgi:hypothetical protein
MEPTQIAKQMVDFQKATFDNAFDAVVMLQDQTEKMAETLMGQAAWIPDENKKVIDDWVKAYKKGREDFKKAVDDSYDNLTKMFVETVKVEKAKAK